MSSKEFFTLAVDCMGGDHGPSVTLPACRHFLDTHPNAHLQLVGQADALASFQHERAVIVEAAEVVGMEDSVEVALRRKKDSSMRVAIELVKTGQADAAVSAGNTGALMAIARYVLKTMDGIDRPAIAGQMPNFKGGGTTMLDLGANVDCSPEHLLQFAVMGSALVSVLQDNESPSVGLLNIGEAAINKAALSINLPAYYAQLNQFSSSKKVPLDCRQASSTFSDLIRSSPLYGKKIEIENFQCNLFELAAIISVNAQFPLEIPFFNLAQFRNFDIRSKIGASSVYIPN